MVYSEPYTTDPVVIIVAKGKAFPFDSWDVLIGKNGIANTRTGSARQLAEPSLPFAQHRRRIEPCGTPRRQPGSQHTRGH